MTEQQILLRIRWGLLAVTVLFAAMAWMTAEVEGFGATVVGLATVAIAAAVVGLWLTFRWKLATVIFVALAVLAGGVIGARMETRQEAEANHACGFICQAQYNMRVSIWFQRNTQWTNCLMASNFHNGPTRGWCYNHYYPGPFPRPVPEWHP